MIFEFGKHEIEIYDNIQDLPILTFQKFNKYQMMASEIGNDFEDYDRRTEYMFQGKKTNPFQFFYKIFVRYGTDAITKKYYSLIIFLSPRRHNLPQPDYLL